MFVLKFSGIQKLFKDYKMKRHFKSLRRYTTIFFTPFVFMLKILCAVFEYLRFASPFWSRIPFHVEYHVIFIWSP